MQISFRELPNHISQLIQSNEVSASFFFLLFRIFITKESFLQSVIVLTVIISLFRNETS